MSEEQRKVAIPVVVDGTAAKPGFDAIKADAQSMAQAVAQAGQQAGKAMDSIGTGGAASAQKLDVATRNMIGSIQRTTAALDAGGRSSSKYFEALAQQRGVSVDVLKPYLAQLDAVAEKQRAANSALASGASSMDATGMSAKQLAFAMRGVPAQFTDIFTSLASGQRPLQVFMQQGGQLKDMFGGIGPAAKALGGYLLGLLNPLTLGAAAVAGIGFAAFEGSKELRSFQNAALLTGNAVGITSSQFVQLRDSMASIATKGKAAEALTEIAKNGQIAGRNVETIAAAAILMEKATGQAIDKTVDKFAELAKSPAEAALKADEGVNFLTASLYRQIKSLEEQGKKAEAADLATRALADTLKNRASDMVSNVGLIEGAWKGVLGVLKQVGDSVLNIGREQSTAQKLALVRGEIASATGNDPNRPAAFRLPWQPSLTELRQQEAALQEQVRLEQRGAEAAAQGAQAKKDTVAWEKMSDEYKTKAKRRDDEEKQATEIGNRLIAAGLITRRDLEQQIANIRQKYNENTGASNVASQRAAKRIAEEENARLLRQINTGDFSTPAQMTEAEKKVIQVQEELKESLVGVAKANKQRELVAAQAAVQDERSHQLLVKQAEAVKAAKDAHEKLVIATSQEADKIREQAIEQERVNATYGQSKTAIEQARLAEMKKQLAEADAFDSYDPRYIASLVAKTEAQKRYVDALQQTEYKQAALKLTESGRVAAEETATLQLEFSLLGATTLQREKMVALRKVELELAKEIADINKLNLDTDPAENERKREELRQMARSNAAIKSQNAVQGAVIKDWNRTSDEINRSLTDALLRGFESGKDFAKNFRDTLKNMFQTLVLRPIISAVMSPLSVGINSVLTPALSGVTSGISSALGLSGIGSSLISSSGIFSGGAASAADISAALAGGADGMAAIGGASAAGGGLSAALGAIPGWGWAALGAAAIAALVAKGGETRSGGAYSNATFLQGPSGGEINGDATRTAITATIGQINDLLRAMGSTATLANLQSGFESSKNGKGFAYAGGQLSTGEIFGQGVGGQGYLNRRGSMTPEQAAAAFGEELKQATLQALLAANVPGQLGDYLRQLGDIDKLTGGELDAAINRISKALGEKQQLEARLFDLTATDAEKLAKTRDTERAAIDSSNIELLNRIYAIEDEKRATEAATAATQAHADALSAARNNLTSAYQKERQALIATRDQMDGFVTKFKNFRDSLLLSDLSPLTPQQRYAEARSQYLKVVGDLNSSDKTVSSAAMDSFDSVAQTFLQASRDYNASGAAYQADFAEVMAQTNKGVSIAQQQYEATQEQIGRLDDMVSGLIDVKDAVMSVEEAIWRVGMTSPGAGGVVTNAYQTLLGRTPDASGLNFWSARLASGMTSDQLTAAIMASPEYLSTHSHASGLDRVPYDGYLAVLHKDETVLNADAANDRRYSVASETGALLREVVAEIRALRQQEADACRASIAANYEANNQAAQQVVNGVNGGSRRATFEARNAREAVPQ